MSNDRQRKSDLYHSAMAVLRWRYGLIYDSLIISAQDGGTFSTTFKTAHGQTLVVKPDRLTDAPTLKELVQRYLDNENKDTWLSDGGLYGRSNRRYNTYPCSREGCYLEVFIDSADPDRRPIGFDELSPISPFIPLELGKRPIYVPPILRNFFCEDSLFRRATGMGAAPCQHLNGDGAIAALRRRGITCHVQPASLGYSLVFYDTNLRRYGVVHQLADRIKAHPGDHIPVVFKDDNVERKDCMASEEVLLDNICWRPVERITSQLGFSLVFATVSRAEILEELGEDSRWR